MVGSVRTGVVVGCLLVVAAVVPVGTVAQTESGPDTTVTTVSVAADGDARWTVTVRTRLENESDLDEYHAFQEAFRADTARYLDPFRERITGVVATGENDTGRAMRAVNFTASTSIQQVPRRWGVVTYAFTWEGFAAVSGDSVVVGDVFEGGFYLSRGDTLRITGPDDYAFVAANPAPDSREGRTITWVGPKEVATEQPGVRYTRGAESTQNQTTNREQGGPVLVGLAGIGVLLVVASGGVYLYRRSTRATGQQLQTDGDRVRALLAERGGQLKQSAIADELDWSPSKTSRIVSDLADDGVVEKTRIGRENVVTLREE